MLLLWMATVLSGCARNQDGIYGAARVRLSDMDDFGMLLLAAGVAPENLPVEHVMTREQARRLRLLLVLAERSLHGYGPRVVAGFLLAEVEASGETVSRSALNERLLRFQALAVLRPDGYVVNALTGTPLQCVGPVEVQDGALRAGALRMGPFYSSQGGAFVEDTSVPSPPPGALLVDEATAVQGAK